MEHTFKSKQLTANANNICLKPTQLKPIIPQLLILIKDTNPRKWIFFQYVFCTLVHSEYSNQTRHMSAGRGMFAH